MKFSFSNQEKIRQPDIFVAVAVTAFKLLRTFGHLIKNLHINFLLFENSVLHEMIVKYLTEYCSECLNQFSVDMCPNKCLFKFIQRPMTNLKTLHVEKCFIGNELAFNTIFPILETLKLGTNRYTNPSAIRVHFPTVKNLYFSDDNAFGSKKCQENDIDELLKLNPQLEKVLLILQNNYNSNFVQRLNKYCPVEIYPFDCYWFGTYVTYEKSTYCFNAKVIELIEGSDEYINTLEELGFKLYYKKYLQRDKDEIFFSRRRNLQIKL